MAEFIRKPHKQIQQTMDEAWKTYLEKLDESLGWLEQEMNEAEEMSNICTNEWCEATEHVMDHIAHGLYTIHEPDFSSPEETKKLKALKKRMHDIYARYKSVGSKASA